MAAEIISALITAESVVCISASGTEKVLSEYLLNEGMWRKMETTKSQRPFRHRVELALCFLMQQEGYWNAQQRSTGPGGNGQDRWLLD